MAFDLTWSEVAVRSSALDLHTTQQGSIYIRGSCSANENQRGFSAAERTLSVKNGRNADVYMRVGSNA